MGNRQIVYTRAGEGLRIGGPRPVRDVLLKIETQMDKCYTYVKPEMRGQKVLIRN